MDLPKFSGRLLQYLLSFIYQTVSNVMIAEGEIYVRLRRGVSLQNKIQNGCDLWSDFYSPYEYCSPIRVVNQSDCPYIATKNGPPP